MSHKINARAVDTTTYVIRKFSVRFEISYENDKLENYSNSTYSQ